MKPTRSLPPSFPRNVLQATTSSLRTVVWGRMDTRAYSPLSFSGPSTSMPSVLPSRETEWQLAQLWMPSINRWLLLSPTLRRRQAISGIALAASGLITPFSVSAGISGTSR